MTKDVPDQSLKFYINAAQGRKATDLVVLDVGELTSFADVFIICTGKSNRQVSAIAEYIKTDLKNQGISPLSIEGMSDGHWVLLDYGHILIHVFYEPVRAFYDLEGLWSDAKRIPIEDYVEQTEFKEKNGASE
ncbi:MAG: ribosome silencing factor [Dissulfuribacterales bacterium]